MNSAIKLPVSLLVLLTALCGAYAHSALARESEIPSDAALFYTTGTEGESSEDDLVSRVLAYAKAREDDAQAEFNCQAIYREWSISSQMNDYCTPSAFLWYGNGRCSPYKTINLNAYCVKRSLVQQQVLSLRNECQKNPRPECFSKDFLDYLAKLQPTTYIDINKP